MKRLPNSTIILLSCYSVLELHESEFLLLISSKFIIIPALNYE